MCYKERKREKNNSFVYVCEHIERMRENEEKGE